MAKPNPGDSPDAQSALKDAVVTASSRPRRWLNHATEPLILYPAITVLGLVAIWWVTLALIKDERASAEHTAAVSSRELTETYEAQVIRALREIDQTLKIVKYAYEFWGAKDTLSKLKARNLLPSSLVFDVSIVDNSGKVMDSTDPKELAETIDFNSFQNLDQTDVMSIGIPKFDPETGERRVHFGRRLNASEGKNSGVVIVAIDAAYFVSGYETLKLGQHGVLGILGADDVFLILRSGEVLSAGERADHEELVPATEELENEGTLITNAWDGVRRFTSAGRLYGFPLAVVVGLSEDEQLASVRHSRQIYLWRAAGGSLVLCLITALMGRMSWQLSISRRRAVEEQIAHAARVKYLAYHDGLTSLPNRSLFSELLVQSIHQAIRYNRRAAVMFLDLDHFKNINDTLGHEVGDQLLQEVAARIKTCLRDSDTVARLGGDEFVALLPEVHEEKDVSTVALKILSSLARPFILAGQECRITASIGISLYPQDGQDEQTLTKNADIAMYHAKVEGKNNFQFYSEKLKTSSLERLNLESGLRHALEKSQFQLYYQAKRDIASGQITGMEALLRWQHPDLGEVAPMRFIPLAEEMGLIVPIGKWVLRTACMQSVAWNEQGLADLSIAVNLTARQFTDEHLLADLTTILSDTGMDAHHLELEISEDLLIHDVEKTLEILRGIKSLGVRISIDDFGIGYSSLSSLKQFPIDSVKIDRSFIRDVTDISENKALTKAIIAMGRTLSLTVVAQGVETKEQADYLRQNACDEYQGFYLNKPMPAEQMAELLRVQSFTAGMNASTPNRR